MSWLPNPFKSLQLAGGDNADGGHGGSVKQELKEIGGAIGRQLRGVADFFAPPTTTKSPPASVDEYFSAALSPTLAGVRKDLAELSDCLKSSLSRVSRNKAAIGISKVASNFLQLIKEEIEGRERDRGVGINKEVVDFVKEISQQPEFWMDYCFSVNADDFAISQAQAEHICAIQQLVPSLLGLRITLSTNMNERLFWMIYFIILLPTLNHTSFKLLSTHEIVKARVEMLRSNTNTLSGKDQSHNSSDSDGKSDDMENESGKESSGMTDLIKAETEKAEKDAADTVVCAVDEDDGSDGDDLPSSDLQDDDDDDSRKQNGEWQLEGAGSSSSSSSPLRGWQKVEGETSGIWQKVVEFDNYF